MNCPTICVFLFLLLLLLLLPTSSQSAGQCELDWACSSVNNNFVLGRLENIGSVSECRAGCANTTDCEFFTFYNNTNTPGQSTIYSV